MPSEIFNFFNDMCSRLDMSGRILEIGSGPSQETLLMLPAVRNAKYRVGVNLQEYNYKDFKVLNCNANDMHELFKDHYFDVVMCNAVLEHDKYFWKTIAEVRRVIKQGGIFVLGVPAFTHKHIVEGVPDATTTYRVHSEPCDYYRFSEYAFHNVLMDGFDSTCYGVFNPPRLVGYGIKQ